MEIPIEISFGSDKPKRRGPPARFASMKRNEITVANDKQDVSSSPVANKVIDVVTIRHVLSNPAADRSSPCSKDEAIDQLSTAFPQFAELNKCIFGSDDDKSKVETGSTAENSKAKARNDIISMFKINGKLHPDCGEAVVTYGYVVSKDFKAPNLLYLKLGLECFRTAIENFSVGPRVCSSLISDLIPKIQDKNLGSGISDLYMNIAEIVGPNTVISALTTAMVSSAILTQQKAVIALLQRLVTEFGAISLDLKLLFSFVKSDQGLLNKRLEVKNCAVDLICELHRQLGTVVESYIESSGLNTLLMKSIIDTIAKSPYDETYAKRFQPITTGEKGSSPPSVPALSLSDLVPPTDLTEEATGFIKDLQDVARKDSWKTRSAALDRLTVLLQDHPHVENNKAAGDLMVALKDRLTETNPNLRAKALGCVGQLAAAVGGGVDKYSATVVPEMMKNAGDSKKNVVESLYTALTLWVDHNDGVTATHLYLTIPYVALALKGTRGRAPLLHWVLQVADDIDPHHLRSMVADTVDCVLDREKETRELAVRLLQSIGMRCGRGVIDEEITGRRPSDVITLKKALDPILDLCPDHVEVHTVKSTQVNENKTKEEPAVNSEIRRQALASRTGARVLGKRKLENTASLLKRQAVSSIPKPLPPIKMRKLGGDIISPMTATEPVVTTTEPVVTAASRSDMLNQSCVYEEEKTFDVTVPASVPPPIMCCDGVWPALATNDTMLMTQRELATFGSFSCSWKSTQSAQLVGSVVSRLSALLGVLQQGHDDMTGEVVRVVEACSQICVILGNRTAIAMKPSSELKLFCNTLSPMARDVMIGHIDILTELTAEILLYLLRSMPSSGPSDSVLIVHLFNALSALLTASATSQLRLETVSLVLQTVVTGLASPAAAVCVGSPAPPNTPLLQLLHRLCLQLVNDVSLETVLQGLCLFIHDNNYGLLHEKDTNTVILLLYRILILLSTRINAVSMSDDQKRNCISRMKQILPDQLEQTVKNEIDRVYHVLEPLPPATSASYGEMLRSANQMLASSPTINTNLATSTKLRNQMDLFKQQYLANRALTEEEVVPEHFDVVMEVPVVEMTEKEKEQEARMQQIRDRIEKRRKTE